MRVLLLLLLWYQECIVDARFKIIIIGEGNRTGISDKFTQQMKKFDAPRGTLRTEEQKKDWVASYSKLAVRIPQTREKSQKKDWVASYSKLAVRIPQTREKSKPKDFNLGDFLTQIGEAALRGDFVTIYFKVGEKVIEAAAEGVKTVGKAVGKVIVKTTQAGIKLVAGAATAVFDAVGDLVPGLRVLTSIAKEVIPKVADWLEMAVEEIGDTIIASISQSLCNTMKDFLHGNLLDTLPKLFTKVAANLVVDVCLDLAALALRKVFPDFEGKFDEIMDGIVPKFLAPVVTIVKATAGKVIGLYSSRGEQMLKEGLFNKMLPAVTKQFPKRYRNKIDWVSDYNNIARIHTIREGRSLESYEGSLVFLKSTEMTVRTNKRDI